MRRDRESLRAPFHVLSFDWNCAQYITPRYTLEEIEALVAPLKKRIAELEAHNGPPKSIT